MAVLLFVSVFAVLVDAFFAGAILSTRASVRTYVCATGRVICFPGARSQIRTLLSFRCRNLIFPLPPLAYAPVGLRRYPFILLFSSKSDVCLLLAPLPSFACSPVGLGLYPFTFLLWSSKPVLLL
ncbi:unnamed protein product [Amoebophrya sp. A120]|nr:unnamed protein product [Amoebophrya sp. A120]|eukprot:GSA120T00007557001.1